MCGHSADQEQVRDLHGHANTAFPEPLKSEVDWGKQASKSLATPDSLTDMHVCSGANFWWTHLIDARTGTVIATQQALQEDIRSFQLKVRCIHR